MIKNLIYFCYFKNSVISEYTLYNLKALNSYLHNFNGQKIVKIAVDDLTLDNTHLISLFDGFEYELEICNVHFPMTVSFDKAKSEFMIKNLLGEKAPRVLKTSDKIEVEIKAPHIKISSYDIEIAGQVAADLEKLARVRNRDRNKFQDGIFITKKPIKSRK
jgi:ribosomal protein L6P/L9E